MPPISKGTNASKVLVSQPHQPLQSVSGAVGIVYELPKKRGVLPEHPCVPRIAPSTQQHPSCDGLNVRSLQTGRLMQPWS